MIKKLFIEKDKILKKFQEIAGIERLDEILPKIYKKIVFSEMIPNSFGLEMRIADFAVISMDMTKFLLRKYFKNLHNKGKEAEFLAGEYLCSLDHKIILFNYRYQRYEVDIISEKYDGSIRFVEVKFSENLVYPPEEKISKEKINKILIASEAFLREMDLFSKMVGYDTILIKFNKVTYLENYLM